MLVSILVSTSYVVDSVSTQATNARERVSATELAEQWLETIAQWPLTTLQADIDHDVALATTSVAGLTYTITGHFDWLDDGSTHSLCKSGSPPQVITTEVTVSWDASTLTETSIINPPYGTANPSDGYIAVQITGSSPPSPPAYVTNVPVTVTPVGSNSPQSYLPDINGCVFVQEAPGTYNVQLNSPTGGPLFIDSQESLNPCDCSSTSPASDVTVVAGLTTDAVFPDFDQASVVQFQSSSAPQPATNMPVSVGNSSLEPVGWTTVIATRSGQTTSDLFPYPSGYAVWYGDCLAEEPSPATQIPTSPGASSSATIGGLSTLALAVTSSSTGNPIPLATASATVDDPDPSDGCPSDTFGLTVADSSGDSTTALPAQTYSVVVTDPADNDQTTVTLQVTTTGVVDGASTYPDGTPVPVSVG